MRCARRVDFGFFDPREADFHGIRALITSGGANGLLPAGATFDASGLASVLCEQIAVGSVAKVVGEKSEEPANVDDVLGFMSAISLHAHRAAPFVKQLVASLTQRCTDSAERTKLTELLNASNSGLIVSARMMNLPPPLVPSLVDALMQDLAWAVAHCDDQAERKSFGFAKLLLVASVEMAAEAGGGSSAPGDMGPPAGKKSKKKAERAAAAAAALESLTFARPEEEVLAAAAEWSVLLPAAGRTRQLVIALTPEAIRGAIPALHAVMGE